MFKKISIRWRLTILSALLLTICCMGLTIILNFSAFRLADALEAVPTIPAAENLPSAETSGELQGTALALPAENLQEAKKGFSGESILYMFIVILGGSGLTYYISGRALKPLDMLNEQVKNITVHNLSNTLVVPPTKDEIAELTQSFNDMTDKLNHVFLTQKRFSASAAHELRTPLAVLQTKVDVFKKVNQHTYDEYEGLIGVFEKQISRLRRLVGNLLDMTNMENEGEKTQVCLEDIFEDILSELSAMARDKRISLQLSCDDSTLLGNVDLLYRAFYNLIENSIKYNVEGGTVHIEVKQMEKNKIRILMKDSGIGIPDEMKNLVFQPFCKVDTSSSSQMGGVGLGLSIVESVIKKHGGTIAISDNEQNGSCFKIVLEAKIEE